ncbi:MAG: FAD-dependent oxidoreductase [Burkholderiales bacterium]
MPESTGEDPIVIIGGGHAAAQLCAGLVDAGIGAGVQLICEEAELPYQRPPLSKAFLKNPQDALQMHRGADWFAQNSIGVHLGDPAVSIDRTFRRVHLRSGATVSYAKLVIATGARARRLPSLPEILHNVASLRSAADAVRLRAQIEAASAATVIGGGFIGLEIAATAKVLGKTVTVLESAPRLLARSVSPELSEHVVQTHRASGIDVRLGVSVGHFEVHAGSLDAVIVDGQREPVELVVLGIGGMPEEALAHEAGLPCANGIVVDAFMRTADPAILAIGDCTSFPQHATGHRMRLESVQNANDQARTALATLLGREEPYRALPWFWSEQGGLRLQMAGLMPHDERALRLRRPGAAPTNFSILHYLGDQLRCVESVNAPLDHMAARKLLEAGKSPDPAAAGDAAVPLKAYL